MLFLFARFGQNVKIQSKITKTGTIRSTPEDIALKWTKELSFQNISLIEQLCWKPMSLLGYANFSNQISLNDILTRKQGELWEFPPLMHKRLYYID